MEVPENTTASETAQDDRPDGGKRGWLTATACFFVNICLINIMLLVSLSTEKMEPHFGSEHSEEILKAYQYTGQIGIFVGGILMEIVGYRITGVIGCGMVALGLFITSFLEEGGGKAAIFFTGVLTGTGTAFMRLTTIVPILECFIKRRIWAIVFVKSGEYIVIIIYMAVLVSQKQVDFKWDHVFRYQLFPSLIALLICLTLKQYYNKERAAWRDLVFKYHALYVFSIVFFFDQFGKNVVDVNTLTMELSKKVDNETNQIVAGVSVSVGLLLGLILTAILLRFEKMKKLLYIMFVMATVNILSGSFTLAFCKHMKEVGILTVYGLLYGSTSGIFSSILDNAVPTEFDMHNVRIVEAVLGLSASIGEIAAGESVESVKDKTEIRFNLAGSLILVAGVLALAYGIWRVIKKRRT